MKRILWRYLDHSERRVRLVVSLSEVRILDLPACPQTCRLEGEGSRADATIVSDGPFSVIRNNLNVEGPKGALDVHTISSTFFSTKEIHALMKIQAT